MTRCDSCHAQILWAALRGGGRMPIDEKAVPFEAAGLVAYNPNTGGGIVLAGPDLEKVPRWKELGATLHRSHFATCPNAAQHRQAPPGQLTLVGGGS